jgi:hypothetical protein
MPLAIAFLRKDSLDQLRRERALVATFCEQTGLDVFGEVTESSTVDIFASRGLTRAVQRLESRGAHTIVVASQGSFSPDPLTWAVGVLKLAEFDISLVTADGSPPSETVMDLPKAIGLATRFEGLLRSTMEQGISPKGRAIGPKWRKQYVDLVPEAVHLAKEIYDRSHRAGCRITLREISAHLEGRGLVKKSGKPFHPQEIDRMLKGPRPGSKR